MYAGGFYLYSVFATLYWETRRSDFAAQMIHHVTTVSLIVLSYIYGYSKEKIDFVFFDLQKGVKCEF